MPTSWPLAELPDGANRRCVQGTYDMSIMPVILLRLLSLGERVLVDLPGPHPRRYLQCQNVGGSLDNGQL